MRNILHSQTTGYSIRRIAVLSLLIACTAARAQFAVDWFTIGCGGGTLNGGTLTVSGTIGQHDAGAPLTAGSYSLAGGFWSGASATPACAGDTNGDGLVNGADLSVLLSQFGQTVSPGTGADFNSSGSVNGADLSVLLARFGTPC